MEKKNLVFLAASDATYNQFKGNEQDKDAIKKYFNKWYQIYSELYNEVPETKEKFDFMATF